MPHDIRRKDRIMDDKDCRQVLLKGEYGVRASADAGGQPYATPLSYIYMDNAIYFHCAHEGHKIENISVNPKVCFAVVGRTQPVYAKNFTTYYESVVVFGTVAKIGGDQEKTALLMRLAEKYLPEHMDKAPSDISQSLSRTNIYHINIDYMTGKHKCPL